jgi:hypothetical protein
LFAGSKPIVGKAKILAKTSADKIYILDEVGRKPMRARISSDKRTASIGWGRGCCIHLVKGEVTK